MRKIFKRIICLGLTLVACVGGLCACNGDQKRNYAVDGEFYTLKQAYDNGWLSKTDLKNISYQLNGTKPVGFSPKDKEPLSAEEEQSLKADYAKRWTDDCITNEISICGYYGQYNGFVAFIVDELYYCVITEEVVGGVKFTYPDSRTITLWKKH